MAIERTFTGGADRYVAAVGTSYLLRFLGGDDVLVTRAGSIVAYMGDGDDFVRIEAGDATIDGQRGNDRFDVYADGAAAYGGADNDLFNVRGGSGHILYGEAGNDRFNFLVGSADVHLSGGDGDDLIVGYSNAISGRIYGGEGNDRFLGFGNHDGRVAILRGGPGNDLYRLDGSSPATVDERSGEGIDTVQITAGADYVLGANVENLAVYGSDPNFSLTRLVGNSLANRITGSIGYDELHGLDGNDRLHAGGSEDWVYGGAGDDWIAGGLSTDFLEGGAGADRFVYHSLDDAPRVMDGWEEFIADWEAADRIDLAAIDADQTVAGNQAFQVELSFGTPGTHTTAGWLILGGFGGELYVIGHTDDDGVADLLISLWSEGGEAALTADNIIV